MKEEKNQHSAELESKKHCEEKASFTSATKMEALPIREADPACEPSADIASQELDRYVERPRFHRVLAWVLLSLVVLGVILYYLWLSGVLK